MSLCCAGANAVGAWQGIFYMPHVVQTMRSSHLASVHTGILRMYESCLVVSDADVVGVGYWLV